VVGLAVTDEPFVTLNPVDGVQEYDVAPFAESSVLLPSHMGVGVATDSVGLGLTVTATVVVAVQPLVSVPIIEYVVVVMGSAITDEPTVGLNPTTGDHIYDI